LAIADLTYSSLLEYHLTPALRRGCGGGDGGGGGFYDDPHADEEAGGGGGQESGDGGGGDGGSGGSRGAVRDPMRAEGAGADEGDDAAR
jgi:hypothetical protein